MIFILLSIFILLIFIMAATLFNFFRRRCFNILYLVSLLFAPPILHPTNHVLDREVFDLLVPLIFFLCQECSVNIIYGLVFIAMLRFPGADIYTRGGGGGLGVATPPFVQNTSCLFACRFTRTAPPPPPLVDSAR